jgi:hypothetical protein
MYPIASTIVGAGGVGSITFSSIPQTFTHLQLRVFNRCTSTSADQSASLNFNGDAGSNYSVHRLHGYGGSVSSDAGTSTNLIYTGAYPASVETANVFGIGIIDILDYANTNKNKTVRSISGYDANGSGEVQFSSGAWYNTSAITSILLTTGNNFAQYSTVQLYGITTA